MAKTTRTKRVTPLKRKESSTPKTTVKPTGLKSSSKKKTVAIKVPLAADMTSAVPVRFGSVGENAMLYLQEGVDTLISEVQVAIATKEAAKKNALKAVNELADLPVTSTMSEIRERMNGIVGVLKDVLAVM